MTDPHISFRKPKCIVEQSAMSWSNKYHIYLGRHYHEAGKECWIVGAYNVVTTVRTERHYNTMFGAKDPKAEALIVWHTFLENMTRAPEAEEQQDWELEMRKYLEADAKKKGYTAINPIIS